MSATRTDAMACCLFDALTRGFINSPSSLFQYPEDVSASLSLIWSSAASSVCELAGDAMDGVDLTNPTEHRVCCFSVGPTLTNPIGFLSSNPIGLCSFSGLHGLVMIPAK